MHSIKKVIASAFKIKSDTTFDETNDLFKYSLSILESYIMLITKNFNLELDENTTKIVIQTSNIKNFYKREVLKTKKAYNKDLIYLIDCLNNLNEVQVQELTTDYLTKDSIPPEY